MTYPSSFFQIIINTSLAGSPSNTFILPLRSDQVYSFFVEWGDGTREYVNNLTAGFPNITHVYPAPGIYHLGIEPLLIPLGVVTRGPSTIANGSTDTITGTVVGIQTSLSYLFVNRGPVFLTPDAVRAINAVNCTVTIDSVQGVIEPAVQVDGSIVTRSTSQENEVNAPVTGSLTFTVRVTPMSAGSWSFQVTTPLNLELSNPYSWTVAGTAT